MVMVVIAGLLMRVVILLIQVSSNPAKPSPEALLELMPPVWPD